MVHSLPCSKCRMRGAYRIYKVKSNKQKIMWSKVQGNGKHRQIKVGIELKLCRKCETSLEWFGLELEFIRKLTEKEIEDRKDEWNSVKLKGGIL